MNPQHLGLDQLQLLMLWHFHWKSVARECKDLWLFLSGLIFKLHHMLALLSNTKSRLAVTVLDLVASVQEVNAKVTCGPSPQLAAKIQQWLW